MDPPDNTDSIADRSNDWRSPPPHMLPTSTSSTHFTSARTHLGDRPPSASGTRINSPSATAEVRRGTPPSGAPSPVPSGSPAPKTESPFRPSGLTAKVMTDGKGDVFLVHLETGLRIDVIDDENIPAPEDVSRFVTEHVPHSEGGPTLSEESDMALTGTSDTTNLKPRRGSPGIDSRLNALLAEVGPDVLTREQVGTINQLRGAVATGRDRLFTTTAMMVDNQQESRLSYEELVSFHNEVADKLATMHQGINARHNQLDNCVAENIKVLRDLGISETLLGNIVSSAAKIRTASSKLPNLPTFENLETTDVDPELLAGAHAALAPRKAGETLEEFGRRAEATLARKTRASAAFAPNPTTAGDESSIKAKLPPTKPVARFQVEDVGSISSAPRRPLFSTLSSGRAPTRGGNSLSHTGYLTADDSSDQPGDIFEEFRKETDEGISCIVDKHLSRVLVVPSHVKPPKLDVPSKFSGMRAMFYGGSDDDVDEYRVAILKNLLDGVALEWYMDFIDDARANSDLGFTSVLCELHRRFITTATAHHAIRDFDGIRFKAEDGPLKLLDDLEACSWRMREPLPEVIIRQRFMKLIPPDLHDDLAALRGISATYSSIAQMRTHANQLWDALKNARGGGRMRTSATMAKTDNSARGTSTNRRSPGTSEPRPRASASQATPAATPKPPAHRPLPAGSNPHADKNCYKCGGLGHIGNDPICPKYGDQPTFKDRPRVGAQRVLDSYVADDDELEENEEEMAPIHDHWGGSQYDSDPEPAVVERGTDLQDLVDEAAGDVRLGTIRLQHFSLRIEQTDNGEPQESAAELMARLPPNLRPRGGYGASARQDVATINTHRAAQGLPPLSPAVENRMIASLRSLHQYPDDPARGFAERLREYEWRHGPVDWTPAAVDESDALMILQRAEDLRNVRQASSLTPLAFTPEYSPTELALMGVDQLADLMTEYTLGTRTLEATRESLLGLNRLGLDAMSALREHRAAPRASRSPTPDILDVAEAMLQSTLNHTTQFLRAADRRMEDRRAYTVRLRYEHSVQPDLFPLLEGPIEDPNSVPEFEPSDSDDDLAVHDEQQLREMLAELPAFGTEEGTPPPSYPGTPEDNPSAVVDISSDEEMMDDTAAPSTNDLGEAGMPLRLGAMHVSEHDDMPPLAPVSDSEDDLPELESIMGSEDEEPILHSMADADFLRYDAGINFFESPEIEEASSASMSAASRVAEWRMNTRPQNYTRPVDSEDVPGFPNPPGNPDDPEDAPSRRWIYGTSWNDDAFVSVHAFPPLGADHVNARSSSQPTVTNSPFQQMYGRDEAASPSADGDLVIVDHSRRPAEPSATDECILQSVVMLSDSVAERFSTMVDVNGTVYVRTSPLPDNHYLSPEFHEAHREAMRVAIMERTAAIQANPDLASDYATTEEDNHLELRDRRGFRDTSPHLLPGNAFHERLASRDPEEDDPSQKPGFRVQYYAQQVELLSNVNRKEIYELEPPSRLRKDLACLSAQLEIAGSLAYMLFDSGSNIDSITPEYAKATNCNKIPLKEQVMLQLGCVGSRSKISFGTRAPVNFGGIRGWVYFDQANLDRYDGVIGTPFMNKHKVVLDFDKREIRFPNGKVVKALTTLEEASLLSIREAQAARRSTISD
ncbi:hypothetical protein DFH06DRAFT_1350198 [Mycena polygramma]|nr:hypothetical protein DFH06DRAFT_1350198 [Mycena polygramma]